MPMPVVPTDQEIAEYVHKKFNLPLSLEQQAQQKGECAKGSYSQKSNENNQDSSGDSTEEETIETRRNLPKRGSNNQRASPTQTKAKSSRLSPRKTPTPTLMSSPDKSVRASGATSASEDSPTIKKKIKCNHCLNLYKDADSLRKHMIHIHKFAVTSRRARIN